MRRAARDARRDAREGAAAREGEGGARRALPWRADRDRAPEPAVQDMTTDATYDADAGADAPATSGVMETMGDGAEGALERDSGDDGVPALAGRASSWLLQREEAKNLERMLSTDMRDMLAKEVWACRQSTFIKVTMRAPVLVMILSIIFWVAVGAYALVRKPPVVDTDVAGFNIRDHPTARIRDAITSAESESELNWDAMLTAGESASVGTVSYVTNWLDSGGYLTSPSAAQKRRRLHSYVSTQRPSQYFSFQLVYTSTRGENVLREEVMNFALDLEKKITQLPGYTETMCLQLANTDYLGSNGCTPPNSIAHLFFATTVSGTYYRDTIDVTMNLASKGLYIYLDKDFNAGNGTASSFRTGFPIGQPSKTEWQNWMKSTLVPFLQANAIDEASGIRCLFGGKEITQYEADLAILHDAKLIFVGLSLVVLYTYVHTGSLFITIAGIFEIILSFPVAYAFYAYVLRLKSISVMQFLAIFIILGIGVDDVFVFYDFFEDASRAVGVRGDTLEARLNYAYDHAGRAMLVTSMTSAAAFAANLASAIPAVQIFGVFIAIMVLVNYFLVVTWFPACLCAYERYWRVSEDFSYCGLGGLKKQHLPAAEMDARAARRAESCFSHVKRVACFGQKVKKDQNIFSMLAARKKKRSIFSWRTYGAFLDVFKYIFLVICLGSIAVTGYFSTKTEASGQPPELFAADSNQQLFLKWTESQFESEKISCTNFAECQRQAGTVLQQNGIQLSPPPPSPSPPPPPRSQVGTITSSQIDQLADAVYNRFDANADGWLDTNEYNNFAAVVTTTTSLPPTTVVMSAYGTPQGITKPAFVIALDTAAGVNDAPLLDAYWLLVLGTARARPPPPSSPPPPPSLTAPPPPPPSRPSPPPSTPRPPPPPPFAPGFFLPPSPSPPPSPPPPPPPPSPPPSPPPPLSPQSLTQTVPHPPSSTSI